MTDINTIVAKAISQCGDPYVFGTEVDLRDPNPRQFDCSELVEWACAQAGVSPKMPDGSWIQNNHCRNHGTNIPVSQGMRTYGALLFISDNGKVHHVAISLGDGRTMEAKGRAYGTNIFKSRGSGAWTSAGLIPGVQYGTPTSISGGTNHNPPPAPRPSSSSSVASFLAGLAEASKHTLRIRDRGEAVRYMQLCIDAKGYHCVADGDFGLRTQDALKKVQRATGISADGICGPQTWKKLLG